MIDIQKFITHKIFLFIYKVTTRFKKKQQNTILSFNKKKQKSLFNKKKKKKNNFKIKNKNN